MIVEYDAQRRIKYNPEIHFNQHKKMDEEELAYICRFYDYDGARTLSFALGRTEHVINNTVKGCRRKGIYDDYKDLWNSYLD